MAAETPTPTDDVLLIDGRELARRLGVGISTIHTMRRAGRLPLRIVKLNSAVRYDLAEVSAWVAAGCPAKLETWRMLQSGADRGRRAG